MDLKTRGGGRVSWDEVREGHGQNVPSNVIYLLTKEDRNIFFLFIYFWLRWVFVAACGHSLVAASRGYSSCGARASHCSGFSCCRAQALGAWASVVVACRLSSCGSQA